VLLLARQQQHLLQQLEVCWQLLQQRAGGSLHLYCSSQLLAAAGSAGSAAAGVHSRPLGSGCTVLVAARLLLWEHMMCTAAVAAVAGAAAAVPQPCS
jgi:hypothetical protein